MGTIYLHTLIAVAPNEKAQLLAELAKTEALKSLSTEQIPAIASEKSPLIDGALAEISDQGASEQAKAMYERILEEQKSSSAELRESHREMTEMMKEMFNKALETQAQVAASFGQGLGQSSVQNSSTPTAQPPQRIVVCRRCMAESPVGNKHCSNCGSELMNTA